MSSEKRIALVTGANRGIGLEVARRLAAAGLVTVATARDAEKAEATAEKLRREGLDVRAAVLDVANTPSIPAHVAAIITAHGPIDVLVNNAAILIDGPGGFAARLNDMTDETLSKTLLTNLLGPAALVRAILPIMVARGYGRIVNVSSRAAQLSEMGAGFPAYRMSKTALNALTRVAAAEANGRNVKVNACSPGWVRTDMGGPDATRSIEQGADTIVWLALLDSTGPSGGFFEDRKPIAW